MQATKTKGKRYYPPREPNPALARRDEIMREMWPRYIAIPKIKERIERECGLQFTTSQLSGVAGRLRIRRPPPSDVEAPGFAWSSLMIDDRDLDIQEADESPTPDLRHLYRLEDCGYVFDDVDVSGEFSRPVVTPRRQREPYRGIMSRMPDPRMARAAEVAAMGRRGVL